MQQKPVRAQGVSVPKQFMKFRCVLYFITQTRSKNRNHIFLHVRYDEPEGLFNHLSGFCGIYSVIQ